MFRCKCEFCRIEFNLYHKKYYFIHKQIHFNKLPALVGLMTSINVEKETLKAFTAFRMKLSSKLGKHHTTNDAVKHLLNKVKL
jgi:hypothetical protein